MESEITVNFYIVSFYGTPVLYPFCGYAKVYVLLPRQHGNSELSSRHLQGKGGGCEPRTSVSFIPDIKFKQDTL